MSTLVPITGVVRPAAQNGALILLGALLWGGGVLSVGVVAYAIRWWLGL